MKGDFSRLTFDKEKQFSRVLMQQGRVQLDADWNEQVAILLDSISRLTADVIGPHAGTPDSFQITPDTSGFLIEKGRYYVEGIRCTNDKAQAYGQQENCPLDSAALPAGVYVVYLDVWERHVTAAEDDSIREVALGGAETTSRGQVIWQVKTLPLDGDEVASGDKLKQKLLRIEEAEAVWPRDPQGVQECRKMFALYAQQLLQDRLRNKSTGRLRARAKSVSSSGSGANTEPEAQYRGVENQLYRVEIHKGTVAEQGNATFVWSRENGSVTFPIREMKEPNVTLSYFGRDSRGGLNVDDWVEILDDRDVLRGNPGALHQIKDIDLRGMDAIVTLKANGQPLLPVELRYHPVLRRWDQSSRNGRMEEGAVVVSEGTWIELEDGVKIQFCSQTNGHPTEYRSGGYWLIPARAATSDIEWPTTNDGNGNPTPEAQEPYGIDHRYAPLAIITSEENGHVRVEHDCRFVINPIGVPVGSPPKGPVLLSLDILALTVAGALLGVLWFVGEYVMTQTGSLSRLLTYPCIGGLLGLSLSILYNLILISSVARAVRGAVWRR